MPGTRITAMVAAMPPGGVPDDRAEGQAEQRAYAQQQAGA